MILASDGYPRLSYYDWVNRDLKFANKDANGWHTQILDSNGSAGDHNSIAEDHQGYLHISYSSTSPELALRYTYQDSSGWHFETVESGFTVRSTSIALDQNNYPHISYEWDWEDLKYAYKDLGGWHFETADPSPNNQVGEDSSLRLDVDGYPHISYYDWTAYDLKYAYRDSSGWHQSVIDAQDDAGDASSLVLDNQGNPHISYLAEGDLKYADFDGNNWNTTTVSAGAWLGELNSMALDHTGIPHMIYKESPHNLTYAYFDGADWQHELVDRELDGFIYNVDIDIDANDRPHVAYFDYYYWDTRVKYAFRDATGWHTTVASNNLGEEVGVALAINSQGYPHISYSIDDTGTVEYLFQDAGGWHEITLDSGLGEWPYIYTDIQIDSSDHPHVLFNDYFHHQLIYTYNDGNVWQTFDVSTPGDTPLYLSLALDDMGNPHVSYYDEIDSDLMYATKDNNGWQFMNVDLNGSVGANPSIALDDQGFAHISYADLSNHQLKYAYQDFNGWHISIIDPAGYGKSTIKFNAADRPHIGYNNTALGDIMFASQVVQPELAINYPTGQPGSYFSLTGSNYPTNSTATVKVNGTDLGTVPVTASGTLTFTLVTDKADPGYYTVDVSVNPSAAITFILDPAEPLRSQENDGLVFSVPSGIAYTHRLFLPISQR